MTHRNGAARSADVLGRWRELAEQRLEHLTELFESGRWRRYYGELAFLENIREAKVAVDTWRGLSTPDAAAMMGPSPIEISWSGPARAARIRKVEPYAAAVAVEPQPQVELVSADDAEPMFLDEPPSDQTIDMVALEQALDNPVTLDLTEIAQRYPLLRNTL